MSGDPTTAGWADPVAARDSLAEIAPVQRRSRRFVRLTGMARPLVVWGLAWLVAGAAWGWWSSPVREIVGGIACVAAAMASWLIPARHLHRATTRPALGRGWLAILIASPVLVDIARPADTDQLVLFLVALWSLGMLLYAVVSVDVAFALVSAAILLLAAAVRHLVPGHEVMAVLMGGGALLLVLGVSRLVRL